MNWRFLLFLFSALLSIGVSAQTTTTFVPLSSVWRYLDNGSNQGTAWRATGFNDSSWAQGSGEFGYGDGGEATIVSYGPNSGAKYITTYFRKSFTVTGAATFTTASLRLRRDDGAVIYLNGTEIYRTNLPAGTITHTTLAPAAIGGADESTLLTAAVNAALLTEGTNVLAVEMHQNAASSSDLSFDMEFTATAPPAGVPVANAQPVTLTEDTPAVITLTGSDPESSPLTFSIVTPPAKGTLSGTPPAVTYTPNLNASGADSFTFKVNDGTYDSSAATVSLTVTAVNDTPSGSAQSVTAVNGDPVTVTLSGSDVESRFGALADYTQQLYSGNLTTITDGLSGATWNEITGTLFLIRNVSAGGGTSYEYTADGTWLRTITQSGFQDTEAIAWMYGDTYAIAEENDFQRITICTIAPGATTLSRTAPGNITWNTVVGSLLNLGVESLCYDAGRGLLYYLAEKPAGGTWNIHTMNPATGVSSVLCDLNASIFTAAVATDISDMAFDRATDTILLLSHESNKIIRVSRSGVVLEQRGFTTAFTQAEALALTPDRTRLFVGGEPKQFARYALPADTLTYSIVSPPAHGTLSGLPPVLTYSPDAGYEGPDSFTFTVSDGVLTSPPATVSITVPPLNVAPVANDQSATLNEDSAAAVVLTASDTENSPLTWIVLISPDHGVLTGTAPNLTYTPAVNYFGTDSFTFHVNDGGKDSNVATVTLTVVNVQDAPVALPGSGVIEASQPRPCTLTGSDADGEALTFAIVDAPLHGTLTGTPPNVIYTAPVEYSGPDSFTFTVTDGLATSAPAAVSLTVIPFNLPPVALSGSLTTLEDTPADIVLSATDAESSSLTYTITVPPAKGTLSGTAPNLIYTPASDANGSDSFTWTAHDGGKTSPPANVTITITPVNDAPVAQSLTISVDADTPGAVTLLGSDAEGSPLNYIVLTQPLHGTLSGTAPALSYLPVAGYSGADGFTYRVNDGNLDSAGAAVSLTVNDPVLDTLVSAGSTWKYLDNGTNQGTAWRATGFDDTAWSSGPAQLGYGDGDEARVIGYGPDGNNRYVTSYFRREFDLPNPNIISAALKLDLLRDDGAVVYLNGTEILRSNMPAGTVAYNTLASSNISAPAETTFYTSALSTGLLVTGRNVIAVEVHQGAVNSSDLSFDLRLYEAQPVITRGPYVQMTGSDRATVRWRTDVATSSKLDYGLSPTALTSSSTGAVLKTEHEITLTGLTPDTRFYYAAGSSSGPLVSGSTYYFTTHPVAGTARPYRFWVLGDPGTGDANQTAVRNAFYTWNGVRELAGVLVLGDTVYETGTDLEFQTKFFNMYPETMRNTTVWPTFGNHDAGSASSATQSGPYYDSFTMPKFGEAGGVASGTEAYYSFDIGNVHFVCLDSEGTSRLTSGNMAAWLEQDLGATAQEWIVAFWHHPPYSKGSHDSDVASADGGRMKDMREVFVPILENHGVDLLLFGHEHNYQRSKFIDGHYGVSSTFNPATMVKQTGLGNPSAGGAYTKSVGPHNGAVFTVAGSSGKLTVATLNHAAMAANYAELGSLVLDVNGRDLTARFLNSTGVVRDTFSIVHNTAPAAAAATLTGDEDAPLAVTLAATDAENDALTYEIVTPPAIGTLTGTAPNLTFTPPANFHGTAAFDFRVHDGRVNSTTVTVTLNITSVNDVPLGTEQSVSAAEDTIAAITLAGTDADGDTLTFTITTLPAHGTLAGVLPNVSFIPDSNWNGADRFEFTVSDATGTSAPAVVSLTVPPVNDAPVAAPSAVITGEDTVAAVPLSATDIDGDTVTLAIGSPPTHGTLTGTGPDFTYTPDANWYGDDAFTFVASDGQEDSIPSVVTVTVAPVNDAPVSAAQSLSVTEDASFAITLAGTDADGDALTYAVTLPPVHGVLSGTAPNLIYTPDPDWNGTDTFAFTVSDAVVTSPAAIISLTVAPVNDAPLAVAQSVITAEDAPAALMLAGTDEEGDALTFVIAVAPQHGALSGTLPEVTYTPDADWNGSDSFAFTVSDGTNTSAPAVVDIEVTAVNDAPLAAAQAITTDEDTPAGVALSGTDADGDPLTVTLVTPPARGVLSGTTPALTYSPAANWSGTDSFTFTVSDGAVTSGQATVEITVAAVNDVPVAQDFAVATTEDTAVSVTLAATDAEGDTLTWQITLPPSQGTLSGTAPALTYTPDSDWNGADSFSYTASDAAGVPVAATVSLTVTPMNDAPVAVAQAVNAVEDTALTVTLTGSDADGDALAFSVTVQPLHGTLSGVAPDLTYTPEPDWIGADSFAFTVSDAVATSPAAVVSLLVTATNDGPVAIPQIVSLAEDTVTPLTLAGSDSEGDALTFTVTAPPAHGTLGGVPPGVTYQPDANWSGEDSFSFTVSDGAGISAAAAVSITVTPVNDAPVAAAAAVTSGEDSPVSITLAASDIDGDVLSFAVVVPPVHGTLSGTAPDLIYTPVANWHGEDAFTFTASDGTAEAIPAVIAVSVTSRNDLPVAAATGISTSEDTASAVTLTGTDADGDTLSYVIVSLPVHGTLTGTLPQLNYVPAANYHGADSFTYAVNDGQADSPAVAVDITVSPVNDVPVASAASLSGNEDGVIAASLAAVDADGDALTFDITTLPAHGALAGVLPDVTFIPDTDWNGDDTFSFTVSDGTVTSAPAVVSITILPVNDPPVAAAIAVTTDEDSAAAVMLTGIDIEDDILTFNISAPPAHGILSGIAPDLVYTPDADWNGADAFTFVVSDGQENSVTGIATITVAPANDPPLAAGQSPATTEDTAAAITITGSDADGEALTYTVTTLPAHGALSGTAPDLIYTPEPDWNGADSFSFIVNDGSGSSAPAVVSITVGPINDAPVAADSTATASEDTPAVVMLSGMDPDGDLLSFTVVTPPVNGILGGTAPNLTYTPGANWHGEDALTFLVSDGVETSLPRVVTISVAPVNDAPLAGAQSLSTGENVPLPFTLTGTDIDGDSLNFAIIIPPAHGTLSGVAPDLIYTPDANWDGADSFSFTVFDGTETSTPAVVSLSIEPMNEAPVATPQSLTSDEDTGLPLTLEGTDANGDALTFIVTVPPAHGTLTGVAPNLTFTPAANWNGEDSFAFTCSDGTETSTAALVSLTVMAVNDAPLTEGQSLTTEEDTAVSVLLTAVDVDGDVLTYTVSAPPGQGTLTGSGPDLTYTPASDWNGADSFTYIVSDGSEVTGPASVSISVTSVNDAPAGAPVNVTTEVGVPVAVILTGSDAEGAALTWNVTSLPLFGTLSGSGAAWTYTPNLAWTGVDQFTFKVSDGELTSAASTATITVAASGPWQLVARTGNSAPGAGGAVFSVFQPDFVSDAAGRASFRGTAGGITAIWTEGAAGLEAVVSQTAAAPGVSGGVFDAVTTGPWAAGDGELLVFGKLRNGSGGVTTSSDLGYWRRSGDGISLIARENDPVPGMPAAARFNVLSPVATIEAGGNYAFTASMKTNSSLGITSANDTGLWATFGAPARLLVRENNSAPGSGDGLFDTLTTPGLVSNGAGQLGISSAMKAAGTVTTANRNGLWMWDPAQFGLVARGATAAPGTPAGAVFALPQQPSLGDGAMTFLATLTTGTGGVTTSNDTGLWILENGIVSLLGREGFQAPGVAAGGVFNGFTEGVSMNGGNELAFRTALRTGGGVSSANNAGLWVRSRFTGNALVLVARKGIDAPGAGTGTFASFDYPFVADDGGEVFTASLTTGSGGVTTANDRGLWLRTAAGSLTLALREGSVFTLAPGDARTVANITLPASRSSGRTPLSEEGRLVVLLAFTDGSTALYHCTLP